MKPMKPKEKNNSEKTKKLTYDELRFPNYVNSSIAVRLKGTEDGVEKIIELTTSDLFYAIELAGLNCLVVSDTGKGKTQLMTDIAWHHFGGDQENGMPVISWVFPFPV